MSDLAIKILLGLISKFLSDVFLSKFTIITLRAWAKASETDWDNKVVEAMAEALGVPPEKIQELSK